MKYLYTVVVAPGLVYRVLADEELNLKKGDEVLVQCDRYEDFGTITSDRSPEAIDEKTAQTQHARASRGRRVEGQKIPKVLRRASLRDKSKAHENDVRARAMHRTAARKIAEHGLDMKLTNTHFSFDKRLVVFQFVSDGRVDFRKLLHEMSGELHTRVELRQIGVRDEASIQGGLGCCGRPFCCSAFLKDFVSINVRMAKQQGLSLNPANISGACGRLKCCLNYEVDAYPERGVHESLIDNDDEPDCECCASTAGQCANG